MPEQKNPTKNIYFFGGGSAEGRAEMKELLGGKGANLAEMTNLGIPVPPGFTISTEVCAAFYENERNYAEGLKEEVADHLERLETMMGKTLGDASDPLLVSVRSGAAQSMPGMMDTVLNLGLNDAAVEGLAEQSGNPRFAKDAYRRFIQMYGDVVMEVPHGAFEHALEEAKQRKGVTEDTDLDAADLDTVIAAYKEIYAKHTGDSFPQVPLDQLWGAIDAVFGSWNNDRAIRYRQLNDIKGLLGTAVNVQSMVFGNFGGDSGTGVCFTRDPSTGDNTFYGEYLINAQGEDVVAGIRTPLPLSQLRATAPEMMAQLEQVRERLEQHYRDMQDMEFTIQQGRLFLLQTRSGKRTGPAAVKLAVDMVAEGLITRQEAIGRVTPDQLDQLLHPMIDPAGREKVAALAKGLNASPGAATGQVVFTAEAAEEWAEQGKRVLLVRRETSPEDIGGMHAAQGILTSTGGMTSHAAVVARGMGTPCVGRLQRGGDQRGRGQHRRLRGERGSVADHRRQHRRGVRRRAAPDHSQGIGHPGELPGVDRRRARGGVAGRHRGNRVRHPHQRGPAARRPGGARVRRRGHRPVPHRAHVLRRGQAGDFSRDDRGGRRCRPARGRWRGFCRCSARTLPASSGRWTGSRSPCACSIRRCTSSCPRPRPTPEALAAASGVPLDKLQAKIEALHEMNPMLGHRGCRLGITYPEIYDMQVRAIMEAACAVAASGTGVLPEIMIPLVGTVEELSRLRERAEQVAAEVLAVASVKVEIPDRHHDRDSARRGHRRSGGRGRRLLLLRHQRPHPAHLRLLARRRRGVSPRVCRKGHPGTGSVPGAGSGRRRQGGGDGRAARPCHQAGPQDGHLRRARRRSVLYRVLLPGRHELRLLLPLPRTYCPSGGGAGGVGHLTVTPTTVAPHRSDDRCG